MPDREPDRLSRRAFELVLALAAFLRAVGPIWNEDLFWHLASGRYFLATHRLPAADPFTYTAGGRVWIHHEWLAQILLALIDRAAGFRGLRIAGGLLVAATVLLLARGLRRSQAPSLVSCLLLLTIWVSTAPNASVRPHLFGWVLALAITSEVLLVSPPWRARRWLALFGLTVLWVNLHSSAVVLVPMVASFLVGLVVEPRLLRGPAAAERTGATDLLHWSRALGVVTAGCLLQPAGLALFSYLAATPGINRQSEEWMPLLGAGTLSSHPETLVAWVLIAGATLACGLRRRYRPGAFPNFVTALAFLALAAATRRMTFFLFVPALFIARAAAGEAASRRDLLAPRARRGLAWTLVAAAAILAVAALPRALDPAAIAPGLAPVRATELLRRAELGGRIFSPPAWGGYLEYRLYPQVRTFMDGRWVLAGRQVVDDQERIVLRAPGYRQALDRYGIEILLEPLDLYLEAPPLDPGDWRLAFQDDVSVLLLRRGEHLQANLDRLCALYRASPQLAALATWSIEPEPGTTGEGSYTAIPSALRSCGLDPADGRGGP